MKIINKTAYDTESLRKFFSAGLKFMGATSTDRQITVLPLRKGAYIHGRARIGHWYVYNITKRFTEGKTIKMWIPHPSLMDEEKRASFARVFAHEVAHNLGQRHADMGEKIRNCKQDVPWLTPDLTLVAAPAVVVKKEKPDARQKMEAKLERVTKYADKYTAARERAERLEKKWLAKVKYYEKKLSQGGQEDLRQAAGGGN